MYSLTTLLTASALLSGAVSTPLVARGNTCGAAPSANNYNQPMSQPWGMKTPTDCKSECNNKWGCNSYCVGMSNNQVQCKLYSCSASEIPTQSGDYYMSWDKSCPDVPDSNEWWKQPQQMCGSKPSGDKWYKAMAKPYVSSVEECQTECKKKDGCKSIACGEVEKKMMCKLYEVEACYVPVPKKKEQQDGLKAWDVGCM